MAGSLRPDVSLSAAELEATLHKLKTESKKAISANETFKMETVYTNRTAKPLFHIAQQKLWNGTATVPVTVQPGASVSGEYTGTLPAGCKYGRVYVDSEKELPSTRKFIVAFDSPSGKAYAESGPVGPVDWDVVEDRLGKSERTTVYVDKILGGKIEVGVYDNGNGYAHFMDAQARSHH